MIRILLVDDHPVVREGVAAILSDEPDFEVVGEAESAADTLRKVALLHPDVVVLDLRLPDSEDAEACTTLIRRHPGLKILVLTTLADEGTMLATLGAGARGFLLRTQPAEELVEAVRRAGAGEMLIPAVRLAAMLADSDRGAQLFDQLTGREREVLRLLAAGLENKAIAARMGIGYVTVRSHVRNLSSKLDARSRLEVVAKASELGLIGR